MNNHVLLANEVAGRVLESVHVSLMGMKSFIQSMSFRTRVLLVPYDIRKHLRM